MYIDDCLEGTQRLTRSATSTEPLNVGVRGRSSDNAMIKVALGWAPSVPLQWGMEKTYRWVYDQVNARVHGGAFVAAYD